MARNHLGSASATSMTRMLVAMLVLVALIVGPVLSFDAVAAAAQPADFVICHAVAVDTADTDRAPAKAPGHAHDCQLCPACHLAGQSAIVPSDTPVAPAPTAVSVSNTTLRPPATGPPNPVDAATPPTGPPAFFF